MNISGGSQGEKGRRGILLLNGRSRDTLRILSGPLAMPVRRGNTGKASATRAARGTVRGDFSQVCPHRGDAKKGKKAHSMQRNLLMKRRSDEEAVKEAGLTLDFDEIARKGSMSREEASIAKWYGIYHSRQPGITWPASSSPAGRSPRSRRGRWQSCRRRYAPQRISFTTRQSAQLHCLKLKDLPRCSATWRAAGMTTFHGCGDVTRNVAACPWASICPHRRLDVLPLAQRNGPPNCPPAANWTICRGSSKSPFPAARAECGQPDDQLRRRRRPAAAADADGGEGERGSASSSAAAWAGGRLSPSRFTASSRRSGSSTSAARVGLLLPRPRRPPHSHVRAG